MAGLWTMIRLILRRDRVKLPAWASAIVVSLVVMVPLLRDMYGDEESLQVMYATFVANPAGLFMTGPMDEPTFGAFFTLETLIWWGVAIAFFNTLLVVRHTRHNEEIGAQELLLSGQVRRSTSLVAVLIVALGVNILMTFAVGAGLEMTSPPWSNEQSWLYALTLGVFGVVWAAIAAVVVQLVESGRGANGLLAGLIGVSFVVRGIGDFLGEIGASGVHQAHWASIFSPFGWMQAARPLTENEWSALLLPLIVAVLASIFGFVLLARRDVGAGLLPNRKGKQRASRLLGSTVGLSIYLQKGIFIGWLIAVLAMVGTIGILVPQMSDVYSNSDEMRQMIESIGGAGAMVPTFLSAMMSIVSLMVFGYVVHGLSRLRSEEASGHLESLLATKLSRLSWSGMHFVIVAIGGTSMLALTGLVLALCVNSMTELTIGVWEYMLAGLSYTPVMLVFMAIYVLLFGLLPRIAGGVTWSYFGFVAFALWLGPIIGLNQWINNFSVMEHVASPPSEDILWGPLAIITFVSLGMLLVGLAMWRGRDVEI